MGNGQLSCTNLRNEILPRVLDAEACNVMPSAIKGEVPRENAVT